MEIKAVKREYQMQQWKRIFQERQESGLTVKAWCTEREISENSYYYHLKKYRRAACNMLESGQPDCLAEIPLKPEAASAHAQLRLTTSAGTLEISDADPDVLRQILRVVFHAE